MLKNCRYGALNISINQSINQPNHPSITSFSFSVSFFYIKKCWKFIAWILLSPRRSILFTYAMHKLSYVHVRTHLADLQDYIQNQIWRTMKQNRILQKTKWIFIWYLYVWTRYISFNDYKYLEYIPCLRQWMELHELISKLLSLSYNEVKLLSRNVASSLVKSPTFLLLPCADLAIFCIMCPGFPLQGIQRKLQLVINMQFDLNVSIVI